MGSATQTYAYPTTSNQLSSIAAAGAATRSFAYDASGNRVSDGAGSSVLNTRYDGHGHLLSVLNGAATDGAYGYDAFSRLVQRVVANVSPSGTTQYLYDEFGHVILETDGAGNSLREYIWLDDMPIGIIDQVNTASPVLYYVHADHLDRPIRVTNGAEQTVWQATWTPFGAPLSITGPLTLNARFPGQWFQIESGLNWNWNRHYDPSTGRYVQPDPLGLVAMLADGPSVYGYARQSPLARIDRRGEFDSSPLGKAAASAGATEIIGGGPEDPIADAIAALELALGLGEAIMAPDPPKPPDGDDCGGGGGDDKEYCYRQYNKDMDYCRERYSYSSRDYGGCLERAVTNRDLCLRGLPQVSVWKDIDVDGVELPKPPRRKR